MAADVLPAERSLRQAPRRPRRRRRRRRRSARREAARATRRTWRSCRGMPPSARHVRTRVWVPLDACRGAGRREQIVAAITATAARTTRPLAGAPWPLECPSQPPRCRCARPSVASALQNRRTGEFHVRGVEQVLADHAWRTAGRVNRHSLHRRRRACRQATPNTHDSTNVEQTATLTVADFAYSA